MTGLHPFSRLCLLHGLYGVLTRADARAFAVATAPPPGTMAVQRMTVAQMKGTE